MPLVSLRHFPLGWHCLRRVCFLKVTRGVPWPEWEAVCASLLANPRSAFRTLGCSLSLSPFVVDFSPNCATFGRDMSFSAGAGPRTLAGTQGNRSPCIPAAVPVQRVPPAPPT